MSLQFLGRTLNISSIMTLKSHLIVADGHRGVQEVTDLSQVLEAFPLQL